MAEYIGQAKIVNKIKSQISSGRVSNAFLFCGNPGMGKKTLAGLFAGVLLCEGSGASGDREAGGDRGEGGPRGASGAGGASVARGASGPGGASEAARESDPQTPCRTCVTCRLLNNNASPDFRVVTTDKKSISVDDIRYIIDWTYIRPTYSSRKVYIIEDADRMTAQAQNALLKTLEAPPDYITAIMTLTNPQSLLETVRSRCVSWNFSNYSDDEVAAIIQTKSANDEVTGIVQTKHANDELTGIVQTKHASADVARINRLCARIAAGSPGKAREIKFSDRYFDLRDFAINLLYRHIEGDRSAMIQLYEYMEKNRDDFDILTDILMCWLRDMWLFEASGDDKLLRNSDKKDIIQSLRGKCKISDILNCIWEIEKIRIAIAANASFQLALNVMFLKIRKLGKVGAINA